MIKKASLLTAFSVTAFSAWAQDTSPDYAPMQGVQKFICRSVFQNLS